MSEPFLAEIRIFTFDFAPKGWAMCNGQFLPINQNQALFSLLGTTYGGNGQTTFALPDLRGRIPIHVGSGHSLGERAGEEVHTVTISELPTHIHFANASSSVGDTPIAAGTLLASPLNLSYRPPDAALVTFAADTVGNAGGSQPHENRQPYSVFNFCIALQGIFPART